MKLPDYDHFGKTVAKRSLASLFMFAKEVCGLNDLSPDFHRKICGEIQDALTSGERSAIIIPRDHFKSSIGSAACLWMFMRAAAEENFDYTILIDTATTTLSYKHIGWLTRQFKANRKLRSSFGDFYDTGAGFNVKEITVSQKRGSSTVTREANFTASSIRAEATGFHFDMIWDDDLIGEKNYYSKLMRQKAIDHYKYSLSMLKPGGVMLYTATRWHDGDLTGVLLREEADRAATGLPPNFRFVVKACIEDGQPIFPERFPIEKLMAKKAELPTFQWHSQWMNDPVIPEESLPFDRTTLYRPIGDFPSLRGIYVTVDPNFKDEQRAGGDYACFVIGGFDRFMNWWGLDVVLERPTATEFIEILFEIQNKWNPNMFRIERMFTSFLDVAIRTEQARRNVFLNISYIDRPRTVSKQSRMAELDPVFRNRRIRFNDAIKVETKREMEEELERAGSSAHDDFRDALADQFIGISPSVLVEGQNQEEEETEKSLITKMPRDFAGLVMANCPDEIYEGDEWS